MMNVTGSIGASAEGVAGIAYLDFYNTFLLPITNADKSFYTEKIPVAFKSGYLGLIKHLNKGLDANGHVKAFNNKYVNVRYGLTGFIRINGISGDNMYYDDEEETELLDDYLLFVTGDQTFVEAVKKLVAPLKKNVNLSWYYMDSRGSAESVDIELKNEQKIHDEHYPYLRTPANPDVPCTVDEFSKAYLQSKSSILILNGEPGTGKTSWIRHFIDHYKLKTIVTYDEKILKDEKFFIDFLVNDKDDLMVIEDAELILTSRQDDGNKIMSKLLNVSEGLVKLFQKKIIFTTNAPSTDKFDEAIIRPGRCYDIVHFRTLNLTEANAVCDLHDLPLRTQDKQYTLAELFNDRQKKKAVSKSGFFLE